MDLKLTGKRALVTGSTAGIGAEIARTLAREGAVVAVNGRSERRGKAVVEEILAAGGQAVLALGDVATSAGGDAVVAAVQAGMGGVDILVNNAAGFVGSQSVSTPFTIPPEEWAETYALNVVPAIRMIQHFAPAMVERGWGRIIQISSRGGMMPSGETSDYTASKSGLENMSLGVAKKLSHTGVTVNVVSPGTTYTRSVQYWLKQVGERQGWGDDEAKSEAWVLEHHFPQLVARLGRPSDIANAVAYVASPLADFINGTNLHIDGGAIPTLV